MSSYCKKCVYKSKVNEMVAPYCESLVEYCRLRGVYIEDKEILYCKYFEKSARERIKEWIGSLRH